MNKSESEIMSFPSDILSQEEQEEILRGISDITDVNEMVHIFSGDASNINDDKDQKDETLYIMAPLTEHFLPPISNILSNEEYPGPFQFEVDICPNGSKNPWVYSSPLNKIFMDMNSPFPVDFKLKNRPQNSLFIRVTPVYSLPQHSQDFVYRCINHEHSMDILNRNVKDHVRQHIVRCSNPSAIYVGDKEKNERLSVIIPLSLPQSGTDSVREMFQFVCKNSCPTPGMNRRPIEAIFTLEDESEFRFVPGFLKSSCEPAYHSRHVREKVPWAMENLECWGWYAWTLVGISRVPFIVQFMCLKTRASIGCPQNKEPREYFGRVVVGDRSFRTNVLGRQTLRVRICSCPKRDKEKEEKEFNNNSTPPKGKKRKVEKSEKKTNCEADNKEYKITLNLVGKQNVQQVLKYCHDLMAGEIVRHGNNGAEPFKNCLNGINNLMNKPLD